MSSSRGANQNKFVTDIEIEKALMAAVNQYELNTGLLVLNGLCVRCDTKTAMSKTVMMAVLNFILNKYNLNLKKPAEFIKECSRVFTGKLWVRYDGNSIGAPACDKLTALCKHTEQTVEMGTIVIVGEQVPHIVELVKQDLQKEKAKPASPQKAHTEPTVPQKRPVASSEASSTTNEARAKRPLIRDGVALLREEYKKNKNANEQLKTKKNLVASRLNRHRTGILNNIAVSNNTSDKTGIISLPPSNCPTNGTLNTFFQLLNSQYGKVTRQQLDHVLKTYVGSNSEGDGYTSDAEMKRKIHDECDNLLKDQQDALTSYIDLCRTEEQRQAAVDAAQATIDSALQATIDRLTK